MFSPDPTKLRSDAEECRTLADQAEIAGYSDVQRFLLERAELYEGMATLFGRNRKIRQPAV